MFVALVSTFKTKGHFMPLTMSCNAWPCLIIIAVIIIYNCRVLITPCQVILCINSWVQDYCTVVRAWVLKSCHINHLYACNYNDT